MTTYSPDVQRHMVNLYRSLSEQDRRRYAAVEAEKLGRGGMHLYLEQRGRITKLNVRDGEPVSGHKPSVDVMMECAANIFGECCLGVIMTGMGRDGVDGCRFIKEKGGYVLGQDQASSDVYGMNKIAFTSGNVNEQFSLDDAPAVLVSSLAKLRCVTA